MSKLVNNFVSKTRSHHERCCRFEPRSDHLHYLFIVILNSWGFAVRTPGTVSLRARSKWETGSECRIRKIRFRSLIFVFECRHPYQCPSPIPKTGSLAASKQRHLPNRPLQRHSLISLGISKAKSALPLLLYNLRHS